MVDRLTSLAPLRPATKGLQEQQAIEVAGIRRDKDVGYIYSEEELCFMMGWARIRRFSDLPDIWLEFMKTKKVDTLRDKLMEAMAVWAKRHDLRVDHEVHFSKAQLEEIIQLKHSPGRCVAEYKSAKKGIGHLLCIPFSETDRVESGRRDTAATRVGDRLILEEALSLLGTDLRPPPWDYEEALSMVSTMATLNGALYGDYNEIAIKCLDLADTLKLITIRRVKSEFKPTLCRQMTWGIIMDCRQYYSQRLMEREFDRDFVQFPRSTLDDLIQDARFARPIMRHRFPREWTYKQNKAKNPPPAGQ